MIAAKKMGFCFMGTSRFSTPARLKLPKKEVRLFCPPESGIAKDVINVILDDEYRLTTLKLQLGTIVDIGANIGLFSIWAASNFPTATIHSYEPNEDLWRFTEANLNQVGVQLHREAVGLNNGRASVSHEGESRLGRCELSESGGVVVTAFSEVVARAGGHVDLLKMDCEGAEWEILEDAVSFRQVDNVVMEYHTLSGKHPVEFLVSRFKDLGFAVRHLSPNAGFGIACFVRNRGRVPNQRVIR
jgi:FkbM family methyltransferase